MNTRVVVGWRELVAVAVGGMLGAGIRLTVDVLLPPGGAELPLGTLMINVAGSFLLGLLVSTAWAVPRTPNWVKAGLGTGLLGTFTTFSAVMVTLVAQTESGQWPLALGYLAASLAFGLVAAALGLRCGRPAAADWVDE